MEDATIEQDLPAQDSLYQQGRFPSIIDTDDLVFEMGKQLVDRLNKDKLLDIVLKKSKMLETALHEAGVAKSAAEKELIVLKQSNEQYIGNNQRLDAELVKVRNELEGHKDALQKSETSLNTAQETLMKLEDGVKARDNELVTTKNELNERNEVLRKSETALNTSHETITTLEDELKAKDEKILELEKKKTPKKKK